MCDACKYTKPPTSYASHKQDKSAHTLHARLTYPRLAKAEHTTVHKLLIQT